MSSGLTLTLLDAGVDYRYQTDHFIASFSEQKIKCISKQHAGIFAMMFLQSHCSYSFFNQQPGP